MSPRSQRRTAAARVGIVFFFAHTITIIIPGVAQTTAPNPPGMDESRIHRDFRVEKQSLAACTHFNFGSLTDCGQTLVMGQPMHIAVGSLAPQNGFAAGLAFVEHKNFANETRMTFDIDALATPNGSWRAGGYVKAYRQPGGFTYRSAPLFNFYSQSISLKRVDFYGLGPNTSPLAHTTYGFSENITGANLLLPGPEAIQKLGLSFVGELNGRFPSLRPGDDKSIPSIAQLFNNTTAPGLWRQASYLQASEGVRFIPLIPKDPIRLNYLLQFQQYVAPGDSSFSFRRFNADFNHQIPLYNLFPSKLKAAYYKARPSSAQYYGPNDCTGSSGSRNINRAAAAAADANPNPARPCPIIATTDKLEGSINLRVFLSESFANRGSLVPFYLSPTIGGSDINGTAMLASYPDYRFRGPNLILFRASIEHSIGKFPIGALFSVDEGKIAMRRDDVNFSHLRHTFTIGFTVRAGGLPLIYLLFAWGGQEGNHTTFNISPTLLGGSSRPSLF
jgi:hypothetical protein